MNVLDDPYKLVTSNLNKWAEFDRLGPGCGVVEDDLPEVDGTPIEVILNKARDAGPLTVCEDTSRVRIEVGNRETALERGAPSTSLEPAIRAHSRQVARAVDESCRKGGGSLRHGRAQ